MALLPGLPNDVAFECLIRVPFRSLPTAVHVSKGWQSEIELPEFRRHRKNSGLTRPVIVVSQAWSDPTMNSFRKDSTLPFYRLALCDLETGEWTDLPLIPELPEGMPILCHVAGVGSEIVVIGGCEPVEYRVLDSVFIYNFVTGSWRCGAPMPGGQRLFFGCATDSQRMVYVAGGHDDDKVALRSALAYDVAEDKWTPLPDMAKGRDECKGAFCNGKFHVIGGYPTETQGRFVRDAEEFDVATWRWSPVREDFLKDATYRNGCVSGDDGHMYACYNGNLMVREGATWRVVIGLPTDARNVDFVTTWRGKLLVIGCAKFDEPHRAYVVDLMSKLWTRIEASTDYLGHVQSGCYLEI